MLYLFIGIVVVLILYGLYIRVTEPPIRKAERVLAQANDSLMRGNYGNCIQQCNEALIYYPHWKAYQLKAGSYFDMREFKKARENAQKSVSLEPDFVMNQVSYIILAQTESL